MKTTGNKELYLIFSVLMIVGLMFLIYYYFTIECFTSNQITTEDIKSEEEYRKCINENSMIEKQTNGQINGCNALLSKFTVNGVVNNNTPYGKLSDLCPISTFSKMPSDCLEHRVASQTQTMDSLGNEIGNSRKKTLIQKTNIDNGNDEHKVHLNTIYPDKDILDALKYVDKNRFTIDNDEYNEIFKEKKLLKPFTTITKSPIPFATVKPIITAVNTKSPMKVTKSLE
jgi:hypothetical protein